jgi:hypothetical protein
VQKDDVGEFGRRATKEKMRRNHNQDMLIKLRMVVGSRSIRGIKFLECLMKKIAIVKELFVQELEQGKECFIPKDLSQDSFPYSFRYYDPIISIV